MYTGLSKRQRFHTIFGSVRQGRGEEQGAGGGRSGVAPGLRACLERVYGGGEEEDAVGADVVFTGDGEKPNWLDRGVGAGARYFWLG